MPVVVIGNLTVGGTGKTPLVIWLANYLQTKGYKPGIVSRGYGGHCQYYPHEVTKHSSVREVGDEALLIKRRTKCPMIVGPDRVAAVTKLLTGYDCDFVITDDGLQHYALERDIEIVVIDGKRRFGNGFCLPSGPLREPLYHHRRIDLYVINGKRQHEHELEMQLQFEQLYNLDGVRSTKAIAEFAGTTVHAVAGIGNPQRFFEQLRSFGLDVIEHPFPDHHRYSSQELAFKDQLPILMTEKDAVKCSSFATERYWCVPVTVALDQEFISNITDLIHPAVHNKL